MKTNPTITHYQYLLRVQPTPNSSVHYDLPLDDSYSYESPFDHCFGTPQEAIEHLKECKEEEYYGNDLDDLDLVLCRVVTTPIGENVSRWDDNETQFARLLCELVAANGDLQFSAVCASMDVKVNDLHELFTRANKVWKAAKEEITGVTVE